MAYNVKSIFALSALLALASGCKREHESDQPLSGQGQPEPVSQESRRHIVIASPTYEITNDDPDDNIYYFKDIEDVSAKDDFKRDLVEERINFSKDTYHFTVTKGKGQIVHFKGNISDLSLVHQQGYAALKAKYHGENPYMPEQPKELPKKFPDILERSLELNWPKARQEPQALVPGDPK